RDDLVTGVQTCALPIWAVMGYHDAADRGPQPKHPRRGAHAAAAPGEPLQPLTMGGRQIDALNRVRQARLGCGCLGCGKLEAAAEIGKAAGRGGVAAEVE